MNERYDIIQLLTKDQVGGVYLAEDSTLERKVTFRNFERVVGEEILTEPDDEFADFSGKLTALQHPNLITIYDIAFDDGEAYMVTQYLEDESLAECLENGPLAQDQVYRMASDVLEALHAAHESGIYHGALNTESVRMIPRASGGHRYMVVDMGLNHLATLIRGEAGGIVDPVLVAPELDAGTELSARADLFMLGQLCYTALAGGHPFAEKSKEECAELYRSDSLPPIEDYVADVDQQFIDWIKHLAKGDPELRPLDTEEAMQLLSKITLPAPEPSIPVAVLATPPVATAPATAAATTPMAMGAPSQAMAHVEPTEMMPSTGKSNKLPIIVIASFFALLIGAGAWYFTQKKPGDSDAKESNVAGASELPEVPDGEPVYMHEASAIESEPIDLEAGSPLDWSVTTGVPVSSKRKRKDGGKYISNVIKLGKFKEVPNKNAVIKFNDGDTELNSMGVLDNKSKAKAGNGWEVYLRIPQTHQGSLLVNCFILHKNCAFTIAATIPTEKKPIFFKVEGNDAGKSRVLLEIPEPAAGGFYTFKIQLAEPPKGKGYTFGLGAVQVGKK